LIPPEVFCVCMTCKDYSRLDLHSFHCENGHTQLTGFLFHDGIDYVYNCHSKCEGGAEYSMGKCAGCDEEMEKIYRINTEGRKRPKSFQILFTKDEVEADRVAIAQRKKSPPVAQNLPFCLYCERNNKTTFITEPNRVEELGFRPYGEPAGSQSPDDFAPLGLCISVVCLREAGREHDFGIPLVSQEIFDQSVKIQAPEPCEACGSGIIVINEKETFYVCNNPSCGIQYGEEFDKGMGHGIRGDNSTLLQKCYSDAIADRRHFVEPPYHFTIAENPFKQRKFIDEASKIEKENRASKYKNKKDWFECLGPYLSVLYRKEIGEYKEHIILAAYLDKTYHMYHIEPLWLFANRIGINDRVVKRVFDLYEHAEVAFEHLLRQKQDEILVTRHRLGPILSHLKNQISPWPISIDDNELLAAGIECYDKMNQAGHLHNLLNASLLNEDFTLNGKIKTPIGFVEALCALGGFFKLNPQFAKDVLRYMFPTTGGNDLWKSVLNENGIHFVNNNLMTLLRAISS
jgi:hypothetical protein